MKNKYISLVVLGSLFATALNADEAASAASTAAPASALAPATSSTTANTPEAAAAAAGSSSQGGSAVQNGGGENLGAGSENGTGSVNNNAPTAPTKEGFLSKISIQAIRTFVAAHPYELAGTAAVVVAGLALWKCPWVRRQLGLEEEENLRSQDFDFEALVKSTRK